MVSPDFPPFSSYSSTDIIRIINLTAGAGCEAWSDWNGLELRREPDLLWHLSTIPFFLFNAVLWSEFPPEAMDSRIDDVLREADRRGVPIVWFTGPRTKPANLGEHLAAKGFKPGPATAGMALDLDTLADFEPPLPPPDWLEVREALAPEDLNEWSWVTSETFGFPPPAVPHWRAMNLALGLGAHKPWRHFLALRGQKPVAAASLFMGQESAAPANVAVLPAWRKQGVGTALSRALLQIAHQAGLRVATLCASDQGEPIYKAIGFKTYCHMQWYLYG